MLQLSSQITYTSEPEHHPQGHTLASVTVLAEVVDLETGERKRSNTVSASVVISHATSSALLASYLCQLPLFAPTVPLQLRSGPDRPPSATADLQGSNGVYRGQTSRRDRRRDASTVPSRPADRSATMSLRYTHVSDQASGFSCQFIIPVRTSEPDHRSIKAKH